MLENYGRYRNIRDATWQTLIDFDIRALPVDLKTITNKADIKIIKNSEHKLLTEYQIGLSIIISGRWYIVYDDNISIERARFTVAHELGHIFLGHVSALNRINHYSEHKPKEETAADMFAARLLAPACVLKGLDLHTANEIAKACCISMQAAQYRANRMKVLYERNKFFLSPLERKVYKNFEEFCNNK